MAFELTYKDELKYRKLERALKKYNIPAYKKLIFEIYPSLKEGKLIGECVGKNKYEVKLPTDDLFSKVHDEYRLYYSVFNNFICLENLEPEYILVQNHINELATYKGVLISKKNATKEMFKINLFNMLQSDSDDYE